MEEDLLDMGSTRTTRAGAKMMLWTVETSMPRRKSPLCSSSYVTSGPIRGDVGRDERLGYKKMTGRHPPRSKSAQQMIILNPYEAQYSESGIFLIRHAVLAETCIEDGRTVRSFFAPSAFNYHPRRYGHLSFPLPSFSYPVLRFVLEFRVLWFPKFLRCPLSTFLFRNVQIRHTFFDSCVNDGECYLEVDLSRV